ncbi:dihydrofolate reductase family protein [Sunxiuqinia sp. A32]|uniref:dihydrofolate reductase family protein n=1 Tax=Sunxiuqinia sp. A32 TaxID=3461496 RepID=UPI004045E596
MRSLVYFMHASLDSFVGGTNGEMNWITVDDEIFDFVSTMTDQTDTALYGRVTYQMMEAYWPTAAEKPNASKHDKEHSVWYKNVSKVVLSKTLNETGLLNTTVISDNLVENINKLKQQPGKNILIFGSPRASYSLLNAGLVDEFWIFVNPVLLGQGIPLFKNVPELINLRLIGTKTFTSGVVALHYKKK